MDWTYVYCGVLIVGALALFGDVVALGSVCGLAYQAVGWLQTGKWPSYTLGSQLGVPTDFQPTHWVMVDRLIHYVLFDVEVAVVLLAAAALAHPIKDWAERSSSRSTGKPAGAPQGLPPNDQRLSRQTPDLTHRMLDERSMRVRFGVFLGWLFNAAALLLGGVAVLATINQSGPLSQGQTQFVTALLVVACGVWLLGRGVRYVFVGPKVAPSVTSNAPQGDR